MSAQGKHAQRAAALRPISGWAGAWCGCRGGREPLTSMVVTEPTAQELMSPLKVAQADAQLSSTEGLAQKSPYMLVIAEVSQLAIGP